MVKSELTITIASGKGGTGKTTIATNLAYVLQALREVQFIDCDVEEPNSHLFLQPEFRGNEEIGINVPVVNQAKCLHCSRCSDFCVFNALALLGKELLVFPELCHGCGGCSFICPAQAISEEKRIIGWHDWGQAQGMEFLQGRLKVGTPLAPPIIKAMKTKVSAEKLTIIDAPPGTSCSMVATIYGSDYVILVTEPTPFGLHDLQLAYQVVRKLNLPCGVVINRADLDLGSAREQIAEFCAKEGVPILLEVPFKREYATCYASGELLVTRFPELTTGLESLFQRIVEGLS